MRRRNCICEVSSFNFDLFELLATDIPKDTPTLTLDRVMLALLSVTFSLASCRWGCLFAGDQAMLPGC